MWQDCALRLFFYDGSYNGSVTLDHAEYSDLTNGPTSNYLIPLGLVHILGLATDESCIYFY